MTGYAIEASGVCKSFDGTTVLAGVDLRVERGTVLALLGPNGAGKTTLVRILSTLLAADAGTVLVDGHDVARDPRAVRRSIGLTGQDTAVDDLLSGRENLVMMGRLFHVGKAEARQRAETLLAQFDLVDAADRQVRTYSGGMRRRLDIAVSLITAPPVLFLDEPTTGLDPTSRTAMWDFIRALVADGATILLTTQYLDEADSLANRVAVIHDGTIVADGAPDELKRQVGTERLTLTFAAEADARRAAGLLGGDVEDRSLGLAVQKVDEIRSVLDRVAGAGIPVHGMSLTQPTLDDVFRALTTSGDTK